MSGAKAPAIPQLVVKEIDLRDYLALTASDLDVSRFRAFERPPIGGNKRPKYTVEQARYRYADAMLAARAIPRTV